MPDQNNVTDEPTFGQIFGRDDPGRPPPRTTTRAAPADKPLDAAITAAELRKQLTLSFNAVPTLLRLPDPGPSDQPLGNYDELRFQEDEFKEAADALVTLFSQHAMLRMVIRVLGPLAAISAVIERVQRIMRAVELKNKLERQAKIERGEIPPINVDAEEPTVGDLASSVRKRMGIFGR